MLKDCILCGRPSEALIGYLCPECFTRQRGLVDEPPSVVSASVCRFCGRVRIGGRWVDNDYGFEGAIDRVVSSGLAKTLRAKPPLEGVSLEGWEPLSKPDWTTRIRVRLRAWYKGAALTGSIEVSVRLEPGVCSHCMARRSGEYDCLVQVRGGDVSGMVDKALQASGAWRWLVDYVESREGVDLYFSHRGAANRLVKALRRLYGARASRVEYEEVGLRAGGRRARKTIVVRVHPRWHPSSNA